MIGNVMPSEAAAIVATIDPDAYTAAAYNSDGVDMSKFESLMVVGMAGDLGSSATLDFVVKSGSDNSTFGNTVKTFTQLTQAGSDSDKQVVCNVRAEDLVEGDRYVRVEMTVGTATSDAGAIILGFNPRYGPASDNDLSTVDEILNS